jgi:hypothetical protein
MVDVKISALGAITSVAGEDLVAIIDDPSVTPVSKKATIDQIKTYIGGLTASSTDTLTNKSIDLTDNTITGTSLELKTAISDETGSGSLVFATSPTLVTPVLGTPASGTLTNCTFPTLNQSTTGSSASCTGNSATVTTNANLTGDVTSTGNATAIGTGVIINADVNGSAAIAYSKLNLTGAILDGDLVGSITPSKVTGTAAILGANTFTASQDIGGFDVDNVQNIIHDISSTTTALDFSGDQLQTISISANTTFTTSNRAIGKSKTIKITTDGSTRTFTFPAWKFVGAEPADQAASKVGILTLTAFGTADTDIVAAYAVEA